jgi:hypothetical protein
VADRRGPDTPAAVVTISLDRADSQIPATTSKPVFCCEISFSYCSSLTVFSILDMETSRQQLENGVQFHAFAFSLPKATIESPLRGNVQVVSTDTL